MIISLEGLDGSGKTYFAVQLTAALERAGYTVKYIHEEGSLGIGKVRLSKHLDFSNSTTRDLLYAASTLSLVREMSSYSIDNILLIDRYIDSVLVYVTEGDDFITNIVSEFLEKMCLVVPRPALTIFLDASREDIVQRRRLRGERVDWSFDGKILEKFYSRIKREPDRFAIVTDGCSEETLRKLIERIDRILSMNKGVMND